MELIPGCATARKTDFPVAERDLRAQLALLQARYDCGADAAPIYLVIRTLQLEIAWRQHRGEAAS